MIRTSITPQQAEVLISVPPHYIGKKLEMLIYAVDEIIELPSPLQPLTATKVSPKAK